MLVVDHPIGSPSKEHHTVSEMNLHRQAKACKSGRTRHVKHGKFDWCISRHWRAHLISFTLLGHRVGEDQWIGGRQVTCWAGLWGKMLTRAWIRAPFTRNTNHMAGAPRTSHRASVSLGSWQRMSPARRTLAARVTTSPTTPFPAFSVSARRSACGSSAFLSAGNTTACF